MISINSIRDEIQKFLKKDYIKSELKKLQSEIKTLELYKRLPEPTQKHLNQLETKFSSLSKKINQTQKQVDKEFNNALKVLQKRKEEATGRIVDFQKYALEQKDMIEGAILSRIEVMTGSSPSRRKKKKTTRKATKKKTTKKAKKKTTRKKTT